MNPTWVEAQNGQIVNLQYAMGVDVRERNGRYIVEVEFSVATQKQKPTRTLFEGTEDECNAYREQLKGALQMIGGMAKAEPKAEPRRAAGKKVADTDEV